MNSVELESSGWNRIFWLNVVPLFVLATVTILLIQVIEFSGPNQWGAVVGGVLLILLFNFKKCLRIYETTRYRYALVDEYTITGDGVVVKNKTDLGATKMRWLDFDSAYYRTLTETIFLHPKTGEQPIVLMFSTFRTPPEKVIMAKLLVMSRMNNKVIKRWI